MDLEYPQLGHVGKESDIHPSTYLPPVSVQLCAFLVSTLFLDQYHRFAEEKTSGIAASAHDSIAPCPT